MQADAQQGLSRAARIESTKQLQFAKAKQARRNANFAVVTDLSYGVVNRDKENKGGFFGPDSVFGKKTEESTTTKDDD
jgi:hypothetical protein